jgi:molybdenum cofactor cytidylyltransferase
MNAAPPAASPSRRLGVVLLAAGRSRRFGRPKMLLPWHGTSVLGYTMGLWRSLGAEQIAVVCAVGDEALGREMDRLAFPADQRITNPTPDTGMFSSVQCAARWGGWRNGLGQWAIVLGDQPHLRVETLRSLLAFSTNWPGTVCQPARHGHPRHPVLMPAQVFASLATSAAADLKAYLSPLPRALCALEDPGLDLDIDTPADYEATLALEAAGGTIQI